MNIIERIGQILYGREDFNQTMEKDSGMTRQRVAKLRAGELLSQADIYHLKGFCIDQAAKHEEKARALRAIADNLTNGAPN